jgi:hypothetical protein
VNVGWESDKEKFKPIDQRVGYSDVTPLSTFVTVEKAAADSTGITEI